MIERSGLTRFVDDLVPELLNAHLHALTDYEARGREAYENTSPEGRKLAHARVLDQLQTGDQASRWWARAWLDCWDRDQRAQRAQSR